MKANERNLEEQLAALGLPDDLPEAALQDAPVPDAAVLARIKARTLAKAGLLPSQRKPRRIARPTVWAMAAALALAVLGIWAIVDAKEEVWATFLRYVPGFGLKENQTVRLSAAHAVRLERDGAWVEVRGLLVTDRSVSVSLYSEGTELSLRGISVITEDRKVLGSPSGNGGGGDHSWIARLEFTGAVPPESRKVTVVIAGAPEWRLEIPLIPADRLRTEETFGPSAKVGAYTLSAEVRPMEDRTDVTLMAQSLGPLPMGDGWAFGSGVYAETPAITLSAGNWMTSPELPQNTIPSPPVWSYTAEALPKGVTSVSVNVPTLTILETGEAAPITLRVADATLNQEVQLGRWTFRLTRTEVIRTPSWGEKDAPHLRVYTDLGRAGSENLYGIDTLKESRWGGLFDSWDILPKSYQADEKTSQIQWFEFPVRDGAKSVTVKLSYPIVRVTGPWIITVPLDKKR